MKNKLALTRALGSNRLRHVRCVGAALTLVFMGAVHASAEPTQAPRERLLMNFGWKFHKGTLNVNHWGKYAKNPSCF